MISAISWVPKGASKPVLEAAEIPSKEEIEEIVKTAVLEKSGESGEEMDQDVGDDDEDEDVDGDDEEKVDKSGKSSKDFEQIADGLKELNMENYDDEDDGIEVFSKGIGDVYYPTNELDPYLKDKDDYDSEELEDLTIGPTDAVIVCARNDEDVNQLEVWICEESEGELNTYIHHHVMLDEFLLCMAWLDCPLKGGEKGNFIAVGTMEPGIEIWDLDIIDEVQPCCILGGYDEKKSKKVKKGKGKKKYKEDSHTKSVLGLAWNKQYRNVLASASADKRVKIWDVAAEKCNITMEHHTGKVQAVAWNHHAPQVLLSGSFDHSVVMKDGRIPTHSGYRWTVNADVESLAWDPHTEHSFVVSLEDGTVKGFDIRAAMSNPDSESKPSFTLHAHDKNVCSISYNPLVPNFLATGSEDKMVKLWDLSNNQPSCVASRNPKAGAVFSISFSVDSPFLLAIGGSKGRLEMWDTSSDSAVSKRFGN